MDIMQNFPKKLFFFFWHREVKECEKHDFEAGKKQISDIRRIYNIAQVNLFVK